MEELKECLLCCSSRFYYVTDEGEHFSGEKVVICAECGLVFLSPRMSQVELNDFYNKNIFSRKFRGNEVPTPEIVEQRVIRARNKYRLIEEYLPHLPSGPILEIGSSSGYFIRHLADNGYEVYGIDPSDGFVDYARRVYGLNAVCGMFPEGLPSEWPHEYSLIAAFHVLEHTANPREILDAIMGKLKNEGLLILEVPDIERALNMRHYLNSSYFQKSHLWDFSSRTILQLMVEHGLEIYSVNHYSNKSPDDKNLLIVAGRSNNGLTPLKINAQLSAHHTPLLILLRLKLKLYIGRFIAAMKTR